MIDTDIVWPAGLPYPLLDENTATPEDPLIRTRLANGRQRVRRAFTSVPVPVTWSMVCDDNQAAFFEMWHAEVLLDGAKWFKLPKAAPTGLKLRITRFKDIWTRTRYGRQHWKYSAPIEFYERDLIDREWAIIPEMWLGADIFDIAMNREWPEYAD